MGETPGAVPQRLARGENIDVLIMVGYALDKLVEQGKVAERRRHRARTLGDRRRREAGRAGGRQHRRCAEAGAAGARSIAFSDSASGVYIEREMFKQMGIEDQVRGKAHIIPAEPVGEVVARGEAEIGFQQISELKPINGVTLVGPLPPPLQLYTVSRPACSRTATTRSRSTLIRFLAAPVRRGCDQGQRHGAAW